MNKLTDKQERFVEEYLVDLNATQAAIRAGYSQKTAGQIGFDNLKKPEIAEAIQKGRTRVANKAEVDAVMIRKRLAELAFTDHRRVVTWSDDGVRLTDSQELSEAEAALVKGVKMKRTSRMDENGVETVETHVELDRIDPMVPLRILAADVGIGTKTTREVTGKDGRPIEVQQVRPLKTDNLSKEQKLAMASAIGETYDDE